MSYWCCAQLDGRREQLALHCLDIAGFETYLPRIRAPRRSSVPLFPGYLFVCIELQWHTARWAPGVRRIISNGGLEPAHVPDRVISELQARERNGLVMLPPGPSSPPPFRQGDKVRVKSGPMSGFPALVAGLKPHQRIEVLLELLGALQRVELAMADIAPVGE
jgi:transcriptional antiterminator RfaH